MCRGRAAGIVAGYLADLVLGRSAARTSGCAVRPRRSRPWSGSPTPTIARRVCSTPVCCSVRWRVAGVAAERAAARRGPAWTAAVTAATTFVALGGTSLARTGARMADLLARDDVGAAPATAAVAVRARPGRTGCRRADPRGGGVGRREHLRCAGGAAAVGRGRRRARAAGLSRCQHARRDDRPPLAALPPIRLGRSAIR